LQYVYHVRFSLRIVFSGGRFARACVRVRKYFLRGIKRAKDVCDDEKADPTAPRPGRICRSTCQTCPVNTILIDPESSASASPRVLYIGNDIGIYRLAFTR
jgi:hypothetical protein